MTKRILLFTVFCLFIAPSLMAQGWTHRYDGGSSMLDDAADVAMLNGRTYVAGSSFSTATGWDIYIAVIDANGTELYSRKIETPGDQKAVRVLPVDNDRFAIVGHGASSGGPAEVIVHRFSNEGAQIQTSNVGLTPGIWLTSVKDAALFNENSIIVLADGVNEQDVQQSLVIAVINGQVAWGNPYATNNDAWGTRLVIFGPVIGAIGYFDGATVDAFFVGYNAQGNLVADEPINSGGNDYPTDAAFDQDGNFYICGWVDISGTNTAYVAKADQTGNPIYQTTLTGSTLEGTRAVDLELVPGGEALILIREATVQGFTSRTVKLDENGVEVWNNVAESTPAATNQPPLFAGLSAVAIDGNDARLYWMPAVDGQLYRDEITYNIYVSETPGGQNFNSPTAVVTGRTWYRYSNMLTGKTYYFVVRASGGAEEDGNTRERSGQVSTALTITTSSLPDAESGVAYSFQLTAASGLLPYTWTVSAGALPAGITLSTSGLLSGTSNATAGDYTFTARVQDANTVSAEKQFTLTLTSPALELVTSSLPNGSPGVAYSATLVAIGGTTPYTWSVVSGALPDGLTLSTGGSLSGTPTTLGAYDFRIRVRDALLSDAERDFTVQIIVTADLIVSQDTTISGGTHTFRRIIIDPGATLTVDGNAVLNATDSVAVHGTIWSPCHDLTISASLIVVTGDILDTCVTPSADPGNITLYSTGDMILGDTTQSPGGTTIVCEGDVMFTDDLGVTPDDFIVTPGMQSSVPMNPVGTLTADILNAATNPSNPIIVEFIAAGADPDGGPVSFEFDFGDGNTETGVLPYDGEIAMMEHAYTSSGTFIVTLTVRDDENATVSATAQVRVYPDSVLDDQGLGLAIEPTSMLVDVQDSVAFYAEAGLSGINTITTYSWAFGDGNTSTDESPAHLYGAAGRYVVSLDIADDSGNTASASAIVYVFAPDSSQSVQDGPGLSKTAAMPAFPRWVWGADVQGKNFSGSSNKWVWLLGGINAKDGPNGNQGGSGKTGGYLNLNVNNRLDIGFGPFVPNLAGGSGGNGGVGRNEPGRSSSSGGKGGNGGSLRIRAKDLNVNGGTFSTGDGGNGGDATLVCNNGKDASAYGGSGGKPGNTLSLIGTKSCTFSGAVSIVLGKGGDGGIASATACAGDDKCPKADDGGNAIARGGRGNGQAKKGIVLGRPTGLANITISGGNGGKGGDATAVGGNGGNAVCDNTATGGKGGRATATGGNGGESGYRSTARGAAMTVAPGSFKGGDGGNANSTGGTGGLATANPVPPKATGCSAKGVDTDAHAGKGGRATGQNGDLGKSTVNGANNDGLPGSITLAGSDGGVGTATGGDGGDGDACCPGGDGGEAEAEGGERGERVPRPVHGGAVTNPDAKNGDANATGGTGGAAGPCCNPPSQGQNGGTGGPAIATSLDPNGIYTSTGGNGGPGGDGKPAGAGGPGGDASGSQTGVETDGIQGPPGMLCKIQANGCFHFDLPMGPIAPGDYLTPIYKNGVVDPGNLFGFVTVRIMGNISNEGNGIFGAQGSQIFIDATALSGGPTWPTWYPISAVLTAVQQSSSPTSTINFRGGFNSQLIDQQSGNAPQGQPVVLGINAASAPTGRFDHFYIDFGGDWLIPDLGICILFEDP